MFNKCSHLFKQLLKGNSGLPCSVSYKMYCLLYTQWKPRGNEPPPKQTFQCPVQHGARFLTAIFVYTMPLTCHNKHEMLLSRDWTRFQLTMSP